MHSSKEQQGPSSATGRPRSATFMRSTLKSTTVGCASYACQWVLLLGSVCHVAAMHVDPLLRIRGHATVWINPHISCTRTHTFTLQLCSAGTALRRPEGAA
jgi:hypothetical protein